MSDDSGTSGTSYCLYGTKSTKWKGLRLPSLFCMFGSNSTILSQNNEHLTGSNPVGLSNTKNIKYKRGRVLELDPLLESEESPCFDMQAKSSKQTPLWHSCSPPSQMMLPGISQHMSHVFIIWIVASHNFFLFLNSHSVFVTWRGGLWG